jgi:hypothetical protein
MELLTLELNDAGIRAARATDDRLLPLEGEQDASPGYACVRAGSLLTGAAAARQACLQPMAVHNRFWDQLDTEPLDPKRPRLPNRAEVACVHLRQVLEALGGQSEDVVMAVPPFYSKQQLGLLVGIARELKLPLRALVASPAAIDPGEAVSGTALVVDLALHRSTLSVVEVGPRVSLRQTQVNPGVGLHAFRRQWIKAIGGEFVRTTRFDPLHDAATEQELHDRLPELLDALSQDASMPLELHAGSLAHRVTVTEALVAQAILLAHEAHRVPGLARLLRRQTTVPVHALEAGAAAMGLCRLWPKRYEQPEAEGVAYHTWRHADEPGASPVPPSAAGVTRHATHALIGDRAHALSAEPLFIGGDERTGRLTVGGASGVASLRRDDGGVALEVHEEGRVQVDGADARGTSPVAAGAEIAVVGCSETVKVIALAD